MFRFFLSFIGLLSIFLFPWWVAVTLGIIGVLYFASYVEIVLFGIIIDALYGYGSSFNRFSFTLAAILILIVAPIIKNRLLVRS